jgi:hypothetical protein
MRWDNVAQLQRTASNSARLMPTASVKSFAGLPENSRENWPGVGDCYDPRELRAPCSRTRSALARPGVAPPRRSRECSDRPGP